MFQGNKDISQTILLKLDDRSLANMCQVNKYTQKICDDQNFWFQRIITLFHFIPIEILIKYKQERSWSDYYIHDLRKLQYLKPYDILLEGATNNRLDYVIYSLNMSNPNPNNNFNKMRYEIMINDALLYSSQYGNTDVVKYLLSIGADAKSNDHGLIWASDGGYLEVVKLLVEAGANIHAYNDDAVESAYLEGHNDVVDYLVEHGAPDPDER